MLNIQLLLSNWKFIAAAVAVVVVLAWFGARKCSQRSALAPAATTPPEAVTVPSGSDYKSAIERAERARRRREKKR